MNVTECTVVGRISLVIGKTVIMKNVKSFKNEPYFMLIYMSLYKNNPLYIKIQYAGPVVR